MSKTKKIYGPDIYKRNEHGLLTNVDYTFNEDGSVNWRAMVKEEYLYPNKDWFNARGQPVPTSVSGLEDNQMLITLAGIKELARLRGFHKVAFKTSGDESYVVVKCSISWTNNYESSLLCQDYQDVANATTSNTNSFCSKFLETIACNRAFVRCVRNYLNIHIVGADEIDNSKGADNSQGVETAALSPVTPVGLLEKTLREKHDISNFEGFKELLRGLWKDEKYMNDEVKNWKSFKDLPAKEARKLIGIISQ